MSDVDNPWHGHPKEWTDEALAQWLREVADAPECFNDDSKDEQACREAARRLT